MKLIKKATEPLAHGVGVAKNISYLYYLSYIGRQIYKYVLSIINYNFWIGLSKTKKNYFWKI